MRSRIVRSTVILATLLLASSAGFADNWPQYCNTAARVAVASAAGPLDLATPRFVAGPDVSFERISSPVIMDGTIFALAKHYEGETYTSNKIVAFDESDGTFLWETLVEKVASNSWCSPCCDTATQAVIIGAGDTVYCLEADDGGIRWQEDTDRIIVNASACAADGYVFITDYTAFTLGGQLYCFDINTGVVQWTAPIGASSGNTPAYHDGKVFVANTDGEVFCFDATDGSEVWSEVMPINGWGFFGGICYSNGALYLASYNFYWTGDLLKLDPSDGAVTWVVDANRTDAIPVVAGGKIFLAGGDNYDSFGIPKLDAYDEATGNWLWETELVGGWTHQIAYAGGYLYAGEFPSDDYSFGAYSNLHVLDVSKTPADPGFVVSVNPDAGGSPAVVNGTVYSIGAGGLYAIDQALADAGADSYGYESRGATKYICHLDGTGSVGATSYAWTQVSGAPVVLRNAGTATPDSDAPQWDGSTELTVAGATLEFQLSINGGASTDATQVYIRIPGDATGDNVVNAFDLARLRQQVPEADFTGDAVVNAFDLAVLRQNAGRSRVQ